MKQKVLGPLAWFLMITVAASVVLDSPTASSMAGTGSLEKMNARAASNLSVSFWGGIGVNADIRDNGPTMNVSWSLEVKGNIFGLIHKSSSGVLVVQGGESRWVSTGPFLGVGPFTVTATANEVRTTAKGFVILFYVIMLD